MNKNTFWPSSKFYDFFLVQSKESTQTVTPTKVVPSASVRFAFDQEPTIGIQGLFEDFKRPSSFSGSSQVESSFGDVISPTSVRRYINNFQNICKLKLLISFLYEIMPF